MADVSDQHVRLDLTTVTDYGVAGAVATFTGPMKNFLFSNRHATAYIYLCWNQSGEFDHICLGPQQTIAVNGRHKTHQLLAHKDAAVAVGNVYLDISASAINDFHA